MGTSLGQVATPIVVTATPETTAAEAAQLMRQHHVGSLVVVEEQTQTGRPVGIVTDRDLVLSVMAPGLDPRLFTVGDLMSIDLATAPAGADVLEAVTLMRTRRLRRLVVVDAQGRVVGLVAMEDVLDIIAGELGELAKALRAARDRERTERPAELAT